LRGGHEATATIPYDGTGIIIYRERHNKVENPVALAVMPALGLSMEYIALIPFLANPDAILARRSMGAQMTGANVSNSARDSEGNTCFISSAL
jgi:hypothetical protein